MYVVRIVASDHRKYSSHVPYMFLGPPTRFNTKCHTSDNDAKQIQAVLLPIPTWWPVVIRHTHVLEGQIKNLINQKKKNIYICTYICISYVEEIEAKWDKEIFFEKILSYNFSYGASWSFKNFEYKKIYFLVKYQNIFSKRKINWKKFFFLKRCPFYPSNY